jgi:hypothetical protein
MRGIEVKSAIKRMVIESVREIVVHLYGGGVYENGTWAIPAPKVQHIYRTCSIHLKVLISVTAICLTSCTMNNRLYISSIINKNLEKRGLVSHIRVTTNEVCERGTQLVYITSRIIVYPHNSITLPMKIPRRGGTH